MTDWATISSLATAGGTLILALATFSSVRSGNRSARIAEEALMAQTRPVLAPSRMEDAPVKVGWADEHWERVEGGHGIARVEGEIVYLALSVRNVGAGIAVIQGWRPSEIDLGVNDHPPVEEFRAQSRDMYIASGDVSFWQAAIREQDDPDRAKVLAAIEDRRRFVVDVLYTDHNGRQRAITRFLLTPHGGEDPRWLATTGRHWNLDRQDPRSR